jgi:tRNA U38,U39,U40 pseudouridine synthase TruA
MFFFLRFQYSFLLIFSCFSCQNYLNINENLQKILKRDTRVLGVAVTKLKLNTRNTCQEYVYLLRIKES